MYMCTIYPKRFEYPVYLNLIEFVLPQTLGTVKLNSALRNRSLD